MSSADSLLVGSNEFYFKSILLSIVVSFFFFLTSVMFISLIAMIEEKWSLEKWIL